MSDYMFMLENHLSANQNRAVSVVQGAAAQANVNLFLTGGAVRDMLGGFPIRDLNFAVEGNALKLAKTIEAQAGVKVIGIDEYRKSVRLLFDGAVNAEIAMARQERYPKNGARPVVTPATIQEDLRCRDFTINAIALSLNHASLGLLLDPNNGTADLEQKELRAVYGRALSDDPARMLRMIRFRVRFGFTIEPRTQQQYENARLEEMEKRITGRQLFEEFIEIAGEANPGEVLKALEEEELLSLFSPALTGPKLNMAGFSRLLKARQLIPFGVDLPINGLALFLHVLTEKLTPKENALLATTIEMRKAESDLAPKLAARAKQLEKEAKSAKLKKPSQVYAVLSKAAGEELIFLYLTSELRLVQDRIKNYIQKYLPAAQEITDRQVAAMDLVPGTPKFKKRKEEMILARVDVRVKKAPPPPETEPVPPPEPARPPGRFPGRHSHMQGR